MPGVYDDEKEKTQDGGLEGELRRQQEQDRGIQASIQATKQKVKDSEARQRIVDTSTPGTLEDLKRLEEQEGERLKKALPTTDLRFRHEKPGGVAKIKGWAKKLGGNKKLLIGGGLGGGALIAGFIFIILTLGSLLIPNFAQDMIAYQLARVTRETMASDAEITGDKILIDSSSDSAFTQAVKKYKNLKSGVWENINKYRPEKVVDNLKASDQLYYETTTSKPILGFTRERITKIHINGNAIDVPQNTTSILDKLSHPLSYAKSLWQSNKAIEGALSDTLGTTVRGTNFIIRGKVAGIINEQVKIVRTRWSKEDLNKDNGASTETADVKNAQESFNTATNNTQAATTAEENAGAEGGTAQAAEQATEQCVTNPTCLEQNIKSGGGITAGAAAILNKAFASSILSSAVKIIGPTYAIAQPACMMYNASMINSGGIIKANSQEDERTGYSIASAADQQKYGNVNGEAIGALSRQMGANGEVARSNVEQRASGVSIDTTSSGVNPQASGAGTYTYDVFDFLGPGADGALRAVIHPACEVFDNVWSGAIIGLAAILIPGLRGALGGAEEGTLAVIREILGNIGSSIKTMFKPSELAKLGAISGATIAGSLFAKYVTLQHMGAANNGLAQNETYDDQADAGMNLYSQDVDRQQNYAAPMTAAGTAQAKAMDTAYLTQQEQSKSAFQRYLAIDNPASLVDKLGTMTIAHMNTGSLSSVVTSAARIFNPVTAFSSVFNLFQSKSMAAAATTSDTSDYGIVQWGWTPAEENAYESNPSYSMLDNQQALDASGKEQEISSKYGKCFTDDLSDLLANGDIQRDNSGNVLPNVGDCAPDNLGMHNPQYGDLVFRWRVAMRNDNNLNQLLDTQNATTTQ